MRISAIPLVFALVSTSLTATVLTTTDPLKGGFVRGSTVTIAWDGNLIASEYEVVCWDGERGTMHVLSDRLPGTVRAYQWTIPAHLQDGRMYRLGIRDVQQPTRVEFAEGFHHLYSVGPLVTGITTLDPGLDVQIVPLPAQQHATIEWSNQRVVASLDVIDVHGSVVYAQSVSPGTTTIQLATNTLPVGLMSVRLISPDGQAVIRPLIIVR